MTPVAELHKAIVTTWGASSLDAKFQSFWSGVTVGDYSVLSDGEQMPGTPMPYCVFETDPSDTTSRMSGGKQVLHEIRDVPLRFNIHARISKTNPDSAKEVCSFLAEEITKVFGGHQTDAPDAISLDNGNLLIGTLLSEVVARTGDNEYQWVLSYRFMLDVFIAV